MNLDICQQAQAQVAAVNLVIEGVKGKTWPSTDWGQAMRHGYVQAVADIAVAMRVALLEHQMEGE